jgi:hypothetical protein
MRFDTNSLLSVQEDQVMPLLIAYLHFIAYEQGGLNKRSNLMAATLSGYLSAAVLWLRGYLHLKADLHLSPGLIHPMISDILAQRRAWQRPRKKREPYTFAMFKTLYNQLQHEAKADATVSLDLKAAIFDWIRLGTFTGSRIAEVAQTQGSHDCISRVPADPGAGDWKTDPIAFIAEDFTFFASNNVQLSRKQILQHPEWVHVVHIRFRYDKSPRNSVIRKFVRSGHKWFCPVKASISIIARACALHTDSKYPLGVYRSNKSGQPTLLLRSYQFIKMMRQACVDTYKDPQHYMRKNIKHIDAHSNRVTAAVALSNAGLSIDEIAFRLRWKPESVEHYLRDCARAIGGLTDAAIRGSLMI